MSGHGFEAAAVAFDLLRETRERRIGRFEPPAQHAGARFEEPVERDATALEPLPLYADSLLDDLPHAANRVIDGLEKAIARKTVTYDFARLMEGAKEVSCSQFGTEIIAHIQAGK